MRSYGGNLGKGCLPHTGSLLEADVEVEWTALSDRVEECP
jgi:hypothetical protein